MSKHDNSIITDTKLLDLIKSHYIDKPLKAGYDIFASELNKIGVEVDKYQVRDSLQRLADEKKISRFWNGSHFETKPLNDIDKLTNSHRTKSKIEQAPPIAYQIYNYFKELATTNATVKMEFLSQWFGISERQVRDIIHKINYRGYTLKNGVVFTRKIYGNNLGYKMVQTELERKQMRNTRVIKLLKAVEELTILDEDFNLDNQYNIPLSEFERDMIKSISNDIGGN